MNPKSEASTAQPMGFEDAIEALESLVDRLESDDLPLEDAMKAFEQSQDLIKKCAQQLTQAEARVQVLVGQLEADGLSYELEDFEDEEV